VSRNNFIEEFRKRIADKKTRIAVVGLGYVGLPLAIEFAKKGLQVTGIDVDLERLQRIRKGASYITDVRSCDLKKAVLSGGFSAEGNFRLLKNSDVIIICVPTPLKRKYHPDISFIVKAVKGIRKNLRPGHLVILESTTYPGTTEEVILPLLEYKGLKCGRDFYLAFSPERIDPGNLNYPLNKIPKVIGGIDKDAAKLAALVYKNIVDKVITVSSARVAETVKLLENTFRIVNIGLIDEIAMMSHKMKIDIWEVIEAAKTKPFGFMAFYPGPGVGGHCIPKDPLYLYWKAKKFGFESDFIKLAARVIAYMPEYVVSRLLDILGKNKITPSKSRILIVGVTYKRDVLDLRKSPALDIIEILQKRNMRVSYYDPLIPYLRLNHIDLKSVELSRKILRRFDCLLIVTDHSCIDYELILNNARLIFDTRNVYGNKKAKNIFRL
jgi:UDP-N-acetyl-D-glucosamine dehydrogenase